MKHNRIRERQQHRHVAEVVSFLRYAFPLKFRYVAIGVLYGVGIFTLRFLRYADSSIGPRDRIALMFILFWPYAFSDFRLNYWRCYAGWVALGALLGVNLFGGTIADRGGLIHVLLFVGIFILALHLYRAYQRMQNGDPDPKDPIAVAVEESWQRLQQEKENEVRAEEERIRKIADENARHRR